MLAIAADATMLVPVPLLPARVAKGLDRVRTTPVIPLVIVVVAVAAFLALAIIIGALAAYIYYCQTHGHKWPGFGVPTAHNGYYSLKCIK